MKRLLERIERAVVSQPLDRSDLFAVRLHREHQAAAHRLVIDQYRAGPAHAVFATDMASGQAAGLAQGIHQRMPRLDLDRMLGAVDVELYPGRCYLCLPFA